MMTSSTGSKAFLRSQRGLTLFEVLISVVILGSCLLTVYRPLLSSIGALYEAENRGKANRALSNQIWSFQEEFRRTQRIPAAVSNQLVTEQDKAFYFSISHRPLSADKKLYEAVAVISWQAGAREKSLARVFYAGAF